MSGMVMDTGGDSASMDSELTASGFNLSNSTDAMEFLEQLLDDGELQPVNINMSQIFWYGIVIVIGLAAFANAVQSVVLRSRFVICQRFRNS